MNEKLLSARLYGIVDLGYVAPEQLTEVARRLLHGGIDLVQLRAKKHSVGTIEQWARDLLPLCRDAGVPLIINDHAQVAAEVGADGVHLGQDDLSMESISSMVGESIVVGRSTHNLEQAAAAAADPRTDYIGFGPLFATPTKPDYQPIGTLEIRQVHQAHPDLPIFCIGGIKKENLAAVIAAGARRVVIVSGILQASAIEDYVKECREILTSVSVN